MKNISSNIWPSSAKSTCSKALAAKHTEGVNSEEGGGESPLVVCAEQLEPWSICSWQRTGIFLIEKIPKCSQGPKQYKGKSSPHPLGLFQIMFLLLFWQSSKIMPRLLRLLKILSV